MMENLLNAKVFSWLEEDNQNDVTIVEIEMMVREFTGDLEKWCDEEPEYCLMSRVLECVCIRLRVSNERCRIGDGTGKSELACWCTRAMLWRVEAEMRLARDRLEHPEWFTGHLDDGPLAIWKSEALKMEISELALGISLVKVLWSPRGVLMEYDEIIGLAERIFGVKIPNYRAMKRDILSRKKEVALFLKRMVFAVEKMQDENDS